MVPTDAAAVDSKLLIPAWFLRDTAFYIFRRIGAGCRRQDTLPVQKFAPARTVPTWYSWPGVIPCTGGQEGRKRARKRLSDWHSSRKA